jgi:hypothetical protein
MTSSGRYHAASCGFACRCGMLHAAMTPGMPAGRRSAEAHLRCRTCRHEGPVSERAQVRSNVTALFAVLAGSGGAA